MMRILALGAVAFFAAAAAPAPSAQPLHFELAKSAPAADATVHAVTEVRLWFTQEPQDDATSIHVVDAEGEAVRTGKVARSVEDGREFSVALPEGLVPGTYQVAWRSMGDDGHVVRGNFAFSVMAH